MSHPITTANTVNGMALQMARNIQSHFKNTSPSFMKSQKRGFVSQSFKDLLNDYTEVGGVYKGKLPISEREWSVSAKKARLSNQSTYH